jgi:hypothetical protein
MPPSSALLYSSTPRGPRRGFPPTGPSSSFSSPALIPSRHIPESKKISKHPDPDLDVRSPQHFLSFFWSLQSCTDLPGPGQSTSPCVRLSPTSEKFTTCAA